MMASFAENVAVHPASHNFPILRRLVSPNAGKRSVLVAVRGRCGRCKCAVCVDCMVVPSGSLTIVGFAVGRLLWHGTFMLLKWPVVPVSATACVCGGEGPRLNAASLLQFSTMLMRGCLGVPRSYSTFGLGAAEVVGLVELRLLRFSAGWYMNTHPPCILPIVAILMCPSFGYVQFCP
jgi:hypothetical protein